MKNTDHIPELKIVLNNYPEVKIKNNFKWLWFDNWFDGPTSGMIEWNKQKYHALWFESKNKYRVYIILKLTNKQQKSEEFWHELFKICVGNNSQCDSSGKKIYTPVLNNKAMHDFFFTRRKMDYKVLDFLETTLVGWFKE